MICVRGVEQGCGWQGGEGVALKCRWRRLSASQPNLSPLQSLGRLTHQLNHPRPRPFVATASPPPAKQNKKQNDKQLNKNAAHGMIGFNGVRELENRDWLMQVGQ